MDDPEKFAADLDHWHQKILEMPWNDRVPYLNGTEFCAAVPDPTLRDTIRAAVYQDCADNETSLDFEKREPRLEFHGLDIGGYEIDRWIGSGTFGFVFRAIQINAAMRPVALKVIPEDVLHGFELADREIEIHAMIAPDGVAHPTFLHMYDPRPYVAEWADEYRIISMPLLKDPLPIDRYAEREQLRVIERFRLLQEALDGLAILHRHDVLHGDISPSNLVVAGGRVYWLDFGLARDCKKCVSGKIGTFTQPSDGRSLLKMDVLAFIRVILCVLRAGVPKHPGDPIWDAGARDWSGIIRRLESRLNVDAADSPANAAHFVVDLKRLLEASAFFA